MAVVMSEEQLVKSCERASSYPQNGLPTRRFRFALNAYSVKFAKEQLEIFHQEKRNIVIWDLVDDSKEFSPSLNLSSPERLKEYLSKNPEDPRCRFVFLHTSGSRGPLCCSAEQLTYLLSHHQVMPSFLDFCFKFNSREDPICTTLYRQEDFIGEQHVGQELMYLGRSGTRIQYAFNILGFDDEKTADGYDWTLRQTTVYHSFDLKLSKSFWIIVKGNGLMRERIMSSYPESPEANVKATNTPAEAFTASLRTHSLIFEWCTDLWSEYIDALEFRSKKLSAIVAHSPIDDLLQDMTARSAPGAGPTDEIVAITRMVPNASFEKIFIFDELQKSHTLWSEVDKAYAILAQNRRVLVQIGNRYKTLMESTYFGGFLDASDFFQDVERLEVDLDSYQACLEKLLRQLETDKTLFMAILQYQSAQTGKHLSDSAPTSTSKIEE